MASRNQRGEYVDPVCGMTVEPGRAAGTSEYRGESWYFCNAGCKERFDREPERFASRADDDQLLRASAAAGVTPTGDVTPGAIGEHSGPHGGRRDDVTAPAVDPVCGMTVAPDEAAGTSEYEGTTYYFCNAACKREFDARPEQYVH